MTDSQKWLLLAGVLLAGALLYLLAPILTPFMVAALAAYLGDPLVDTLERLRIRRGLAVTAVFALLLAAGLGLLLVLVPLLARQLTLLAEHLPRALAWVQAEVWPRLAALPGVEDLAIEPQAVRGALAQHWRELGGAASWLAGGVVQSGQALVAWIGYLLLVPVVTFYLLRDWDTLIERLRELVPRRFQPAVIGLARECDEVLGAFLRGQLLVMLILAVVYTIGLGLVGLDLAVLIGMVAGLVSFVPYLGVIVGAGAALAAAAVQFQEWLPLVAVAAVFVFGQILEGMVLSPVLVGERIGLHPVAVIFAVLAGGQLFGLLGVLLALPVAAVVAVLLRDLHRRYVDSALYTP